MAYNFGRGGGFGRRQSPMNRFSTSWTQPSRRQKDIQGAIQGSMRNQNPWVGALTDILGNLIGGEKGGSVLDRFGGAIGDAIGGIFSPQEANAQPAKRTLPKTPAQKKGSSLSSFGIKPLVGSGAGDSGDPLTGLAPSRNIQSYKRGQTSGGGGSLWGGIKNLGKGALDLFGSDLGKMGLGLGLSYLGEKLAPEPEPIPTSRFATQMEEGDITPRTSIGREAMGKASDLLGQEYEGLPEDYKESMLADFDKTFEDEEEQLRQEYKRLRPYADIENDSAFKKDLMELRSNQAERKENLLAKLEQREHERFQAQQRQDIQQAMGIDEQTFNEYASLANQDLNRIMMQTGLDYGQAQQFKDMFGKIGGQFIASGLEGMGGE